MVTHLVEGRDPTVLSLRHLHGAEEGPINIEVHCIFHKTIGVSLRIHIPHNYYYKGINVSFDFMITESSLSYLYYLAYFIVKLFGMGQLFFRNLIPELDISEDLCMVKSLRD